jgi:hypothetical protein
VPQASNESGVAHGISESYQAEEAPRADHREGDLRLSGNLFHLSRSRVREEIDVRIAGEKEWEHGTTGVDAAVADGHQHRHTGTLKQLPHPIALGPCGVHREGLKQIWSSEHDAYRRSTRAQTTNRAKPGAARVDVATGADTGVRAAKVLTHLIGLTKTGTLPICLFSTPGECR